MIPMFTLGIPGEAATAVMLGGLMLLGLQPGPLLFKENPQVIYTVFASTITSNLLILVLGLIGARFFAKVLQLPMKLITTLIFVLAIIGSYAMRNNVFDVGVTIIAGFLGYILVKADYPVPPCCLASSLGLLWSLIWDERLLFLKVICLYSSQGRSAGFFGRSFCIQ
jgi:putative tricarboxylic transport membrane protein